MNSNQLPSGLADEAELCKKHGITYINEPITDLTLPSSASDFAATTKTWFNQISLGEKWVIHCRAGIGRSGMTAAAILMHNGVSGPEAIELITAARGTTIPDTDEQKHFILQLERYC